MNFRHSFNSSLGSLKYVKKVLSVSNFLSNILVFKVGFLECYFMQLNISDRVEQQRVPDIKRKSMYLSARVLITCGLLYADSLMNPYLV